LAAHKGVSDRIFGEVFKKRKKKSEQILQLSKLEKLGGNGSMELIIIEGPVANGSFFPHGWSNPYKMTNCVHRPSSVGKVPVSWFPGISLLTRQNKVDLINSW